jgi:parallel beta-helix repeat protein
MARRKKYSYKKDIKNPLYLALIIILFIATISLIFTITISPQFTRLSKPSGGAGPSAPPSVSPFYKAGTLEAYHVGPPNMTKVYRYDNFELETYVKCVGGYCGDVTAIADPYPSDEIPQNKLLASDMIQIEDLLNENRPVDVIVWLKNNEYTTPQYQENIDRKRKEIKNIQDSVLSGLRNFEIIRIFRVTNGFFGTLKTIEDYETIKTSPSFDKIYIDRKVEATLDESNPLIGAEIVEQELEITGKGISVCVLDTGVDYTHENLGGCFGPGCKVVGGYDFYSHDEDPFDLNGHGTHVAGIVASEHELYRGIAPGANIVAGRVLGPFGSGSFGLLTAGIDWCTDNKDNFTIKIITMSLGEHGQYLPEDCPDYSNPALESAYNAGIFIDSSSGNDAHSWGVSYPACADPWVTSVGATYDENLGPKTWSKCADLNTYPDLITCWTNKGPNLDLLAPGSVTTSTSATYGSNCGAPFGKFGDCSGTSMSSPHVAGVAALLLEINPKLTPLEVENVLKETGVPIYDPPNQLTYPRIDAFMAVEPIIKGAVPMNSGSPFYTITTNPMTGKDNPCLNNMNNGDVCKTSWIINSTTQKIGYAYTFFTEYSSPLAKTVKSKEIKIIVELDPEGDDDMDGWNNTVDCEPFNPNAHPGIEWDICGNSIDDNCDNKTDWKDMDKDGFNACLDDCSDNTTFNPSYCPGDPAKCSYPDHKDCAECINAGVKEVCDDNFDNNCDTFSDCYDDQCIEDPICKRECDGVPTNHCDITKSTKFNLNDYYLPNGVVIKTSNIELDCNNALLYGNITKVGNGITLDYKVDNITIKNCKMENYSLSDLSGWPYSKCIHIEYPSGWYKITNSEFTNCFRGIRSWGTPSETYEITINDNIFTDSIQNSITIGASTPHIYDNTFINKLPPWYGLTQEIYLYSTGQNIIENNYMNSRFIGMELYPNSSIVRNNFINGTLIGISNRGDDTLIEGNTINSPIRRGIDSWGNDNVLIRNNIITVSGWGAQSFDTMGDGIGISGYNVTLENNTVIDGYENGMSLQIDTGVVKDNTFCDNAIGWGNPIEKFYDIRDWGSNDVKGVNNTCDTTKEWNDYGVTGCTNSCGCTCSTCDECVMRLSHPGCQEVFLTANIIDNEGTCIYDPDFSDNKVFDCQGHTIDIDTNYMFQGDAIRLIGIKGFTVKNCNITEFRYGISIWSQSNHVIIENNYIHNIEQYGIRSDGSDYVIIRNNTILNSGFNGIYHKDGVQGEMTENRVYYSGDSGIRFQNGDGDISNNEVCFNGDPKYYFDIDNLGSATGSQNICDYANNFQCDFPC